MHNASEWRSLSLKQCREDVAPRLYANSSQRLVIRNMNEGSGVDVRRHEWGVALEEIPTVAYQDADRTQSSHIAQLLALQPF